MLKYIVLTSFLFTFVVSNCFAYTDCLLRLGTNIKVQKRAISVSAPGVENIKAFGQIALELSILILHEGENLILHPLWKWIVSEANGCEVLLKTHEREASNYSDIDSLPKKLPGPKKFSIRLIRTVIRLINGSCDAPVPKRVPWAISTVSRAHLLSALSYVDILHNVQSGKLDEAYENAIFAEDIFIPYYNYVPNRDLLFYIIATIANKKSDTEEARKYHRLVVHLFPSSSVYKQSAKWLKSHSAKTTLSRQDIAEYLQLNKPLVYFDLLRIIRTNFRIDAIDLLVDYAKELENDEIKLEDCIETIGVLGDKRSAPFLKRMLYRAESEETKRSLNFALVLLSEFRHLDEYVRLELSLGKSLHSIDELLRETFNGGPTIANVCKKPLKFSSRWRTWLSGRARSN